MATQIIGKGMKNIRRLFRTWKNPLILMFIDTMVDMLREFRMRIAQVSGGIERAQQHHRHILQAINDRNPQAARVAMKEHLRQVREDSETSLTLSKTDE